MSTRSQIGGASPAEECRRRLLVLAARLAERARTLERAHDSRCVFTHAYWLMTQRIVEEMPRIAGINQTWIADLAEAFAARYFAALDGREAEISPAWKRAFAAMRDRRTSVLEDLVFAMTVHIVHDLPLALGDVSSDRSPERAHIYDFHAVNDMMASSIDAIEVTTARRYSPYIAWLDKLSHPYDQILTDYGIRMARGLAWYNALRLADKRSVEQAKEAIERSPIIVIDEIVRPPIWSLRVVLRMLRWIVSFLRRWPPPTSTRGMTLPPLKRRPRRTRAGRTSQ